jgi:histidine triad (HIT) family protein
MDHPSPSSLDQACIFCRIVSGKAPVSIVAETARAVAFMDVNQPTPGHVLIVPRDHLMYLYDLDAETGAEVFRLTTDVARAVKRALKPDGLNLFQANEAAGQQEVFHFHMHIVARYAGDRDRVRFGWRTELSPRSELDNLAKTIESAMPK